MAPHLDRRAEEPGDDAQVGAQVEDVPPGLPEDQEGGLAVRPHQGVVLAGDEADERGFARAVGAQDGQVLAGADLEVQVLQDGLVPPDQGGPAEREQRRVLGHGVFQDPSVAPLAWRSEVLGP